MRIGRFYYLSRRIAFGPFDCVQKIFSPPFLKMSAPEFRSGYVAIVGAPNVGKSTLLNQILQTKLSIVSPKPQTTRDRILGILNNQNFQMVFVDTPGWVEAKDAFRSMMRRSIQDAVKNESDVLVWVTDPQHRRNLKEFGQFLSLQNKPIFAVINKRDQDPEGRSGDLIAEDLRSCSIPDENIFRISAKTGQGLKILMNRLSSMIPISPPYYPTDQLTDRWERFYVAELIREQLFLQTQDEIPHATAVLIEEFEENPGKKDHIKVHLVCESNSQKAILIGRKGSAIRSLGEASRKSIENQLGRPVFLGMSVKVSKGWRKNPEFLKNLEGNFYK